MAKMVVKIALAGAVEKLRVAQKLEIVAKLAAAVKAAEARYCPAQESAGQAELVPQRRKQFFQKYNWISVESNSSLSPMPRILTDGDVKNAPNSTFSIFYLNCLRPL